MAAAQRGTEHRGDVGSLSYAGVQVDALRRAKKLHITSTMMAPTTAPIRPAPSSARYQPSAWPSRFDEGAGDAERVVRMKPAGSLEPGWRNSQSCRQRSR